MKKGFIFLVALVAVVAAYFIYSGSQPEQKGKVIAIATLVPHPALDDMIDNIKVELAENGLIEGQDVTYIMRNAGGQMSVCATIASELGARNDIDLTIAVTAPMSQAMAKTVKGPFIFAAVTDPVGAGLTTDLNKGFGDRTGSSDAWAYEDQLLLIKKITPEVKTIGVILNPGEAASQNGIKEFRKYAAIHDLDLIEGAVNSTNEIYAVAMSLAGRSDALLLSSDSTAISGMAGALRVAIEHKRPLYVGDSGTVAKGGLATVSTGYSQLGRDTGKLALRLLNGERDIPVVVGKGTDVYLNTEAAQLMGVVIPQDVLDSAYKVYESIEQ